MEKNARFKYNLNLEYVLWDLFGRKNYQGTAGSFQDPSFTRMCLLRAVKKIRKRLNEIPMDERLIMNSGLILDRLKGDINKISEETNTDWRIITNLLHLIVHLIGYDQLDGKSHRSVFFFQNKGQEQEDWIWQEGAEKYYDHFRKEEKHRYMLVNQLQNNNIPKYQISKLLGLSIKRVNQIISEIEKHEQETEEKIPKFM